MSWTAVRGAALVAALFVSIPGAAQTPQPRASRPPSPWLPRLQLDNDAYNFWIHPGRRTDEEYTNGVVASVESLRGSRLSRLLGEGEACGLEVIGAARCHRTVLSIGQEMYTPNLRRAPFTRPDWESERPYAGWLWVGATAHSGSLRTQRTLDVQLGVTGAPALGQVSQRVAHWINAKYTRKAEGWETQVGFQPGVQVGYTQSVRLLRSAIAGRTWIDVVPTARVALGTVRTAADVSGRLRLGYNLSHPFDPRRARGRSHLEYWLTASGRSSWVARDATLDGSILGDDRRVERVPGVTEYAFGAALRMHRLMLQWEATTRSRQYETGPGHHTWSTMVASWEFFR